MGNISLKIVLVYSDRAGAGLGKVVARSLVEKLGCAFRARQSSWNTDLLRSSKLRAMAALEAREADMVMIAMDEGVPLPPEVREWLALWRDRRRAVPGALVALLRRDAEEAPPVVGEALHAFANEARMDFFCHSELRPSHPRPRIHAPSAPALAGAVH